MIAIGGIGGGGLVGVVVELGKSLGLLSDLARDVGCRRPDGGCSAPRMRGTAQRANEDCARCDHCLASDGGLCSACRARSAPGGGGARTRTERCRWFQRPWPRGPATPKNCERRPTGAAFSFRGACSISASRSRTPRRRGLISMILSEWCRFQESDDRLEIFSASCSVMIRSQLQIGRELEIVVGGTWHAASCRLSTARSVRRRQHGQTHMRNAFKCVQKCASVYWMELTGQRPHSGSLFLMYRHLTARSGLVGGGGLLHSALELALQNR